MSKIRKIWLGFEKRFNTTHSSIEVKQLWERESNRLLAKYRGDRLFKMQVALDCAAFEAYRVWTGFEKIFAAVV